MTEICRACLSITDKARFYYLDTFDNAQIVNTIPKDVLQVCVPEMDLYISEQPGVCKECLDKFELFYNFKNKCLATEEKILDYVKRNKISNLHDKIDLASVLIDKPIANSTESEAPEEIKLNDTHNVVLIKKQSPEKAAKQQMQVGEVKEVLLLQCNACPFVALNQSQLSSHKCIPPNSLLTKSYQCSFCNYTSTRNYRLKHHISVKHYHCTHYACNKCSFKTADLDQLQLHTKTMHFTVPEIYRCPQCDFTASSAFMIKRHRVKTHGPIIHHCQFCSYSTKDGSNFKKHQFVHQGKPKKCTRCSFQCVSPYQLQSHIKRCH